MPLFAVASPSGSSLAPDASTGSQVTATPPGDTSKPMEVEEQEVRDYLMTSSPGGDSPAPGVTLTDDIVDATGGLQRTSRTEAKSLSDVVAWRPKRSSSLGSGANAKLTVSFAGDNLHQSHDASAVPSPSGAGPMTSLRNLPGLKSPLARPQPRTNQAAARLLARPSTVSPFSKSYLLLALTCCSTTRSSGRKSSN